MAAVRWEFDKQEGNETKKRKNTMNAHDDNANNAIQGNDHDENWRLTAREMKKQCDLDSIVSLEQCSHR